MANHKNLQPENFKLFFEHLRVDTGAKFATSVVDTGGKFAAGVVDTGGIFGAGVVDTGGAP
jgi:hypothetical protein